MMKASIVLTVELFLPTNYVSMHGLSVRPRGCHCPSQLCNTWAALFRRICPHEPC